MPLALRKKNRRRNNLDAAETVYFTNQLAMIRPKTYDVKMPEFKARTFVPVNTNIPNGVEVLKYRQYDQVGSAKIIASYADDLPRVDVFGKEFAQQIRSIGDAYGYNLQEIRAAAQGGFDLEQRKANTARRAIEQTIDQIARTGDADHGLLGLLNQPNANVYTVPNGAGGSPAWALKTVDEILADLFGIQQYQVNLTKEVEIPNTILLPLDSFALLNRTRITNTTTTVLQFFLANSPYVKNIETWAELDTAGSGGTKRMVCYRRDPDVLELPIPQDFEQLEPEKRNLEWVTDCHARVGGVIVFYPMAITYGDGI